MKEEIQQIFEGIKERGIPILEVMRTLKLFPVLEQFFAAVLLVFLPPAVTSFLFLSIHNAKERRASFKGMQDRAGGNLLLVGLVISTPKKVKTKNGVALYI